MLGQTGQCKNWMINWSFLWDIELRNNYLLQQLSDANVHNSSGLMSRRQRKENKCSPSTSPGQWAGTLKRQIKPSNLFGEMKKLILKLFRLINIIGGQSDKMQGVSPAGGHWPGRNDIL